MDHNIKDEKEAEDLRLLNEQARVTFAGECDFIAGAATVEMIPNDLLPEIAFIGRSNVGKSTLINAITSRKALARTSHTPGRTQQLNFFNLSNKFIMVDMPGYGYAKVSKSQKKIWENLIGTYLKGRVSLRCVFLLIDSRHGLKDSDREMMNMLDSSAVQYKIILTKIDKQNPTDLLKITEKIKLELKEHAAAFPEIIATSSDKKNGIEEVRVEALKSALCLAV